MSQDSLVHKQFKAVQRKQRTRSRLHGTAQRPRLSINISNKHISAQIIDDDSGQTLAYTSTAGQKISGPLAEKAAWIGAEIAKKAKKSKIRAVIFDRGGLRYHQRVKQLAEAARSNGLEF